MLLSVMPPAGCLIAFIHSLTVPLRLLGPSSLMPLRSSFFLCWLSLLLLASPWASQSMSGLFPRHFITTSWRSTFWCHGRLIATTQGWPYLWFADLALYNTTSKSAPHRPGTHLLVSSKAPSKAKPSPNLKGTPLKSSIGTAHPASLLADNKVPLYAKSGTDFIYKGYINKMHCWLTTDSDDKLLEISTPTYSVSKRHLLVQRVLIDRGVNGTVGGSDCTWIGGP